MVEEVSDNVQQEPVRLSEPSGWKLNEELLCGLAVFAIVYTTILIPVAIFMSNHCDEPKTRWEYILPAKTVGCFMKESIDD